MAIAPTPALAARAKKLSNEKPTLWSVTLMAGRPTMPGKTAPSDPPNIEGKDHWFVADNLGTFYWCSR